MYTRSRQKKWSAQYGFTLVETIVVIAVFIVVQLGIVEAIVLFYHYNSYSIAQAGQVDNARHAMDVMVRDIREMNYSDNGSFPLAIMQPNKIGFYSDVDRDNSVEYVVYEVSTTTQLTKKIYRATGNPPVYSTTPDSTALLSDYVQNLNQATSTFFYYDANGKLATPTTTVTDIAYIRAQVIVNIDPARDPGQFMLRSSAALRNLKDNF